MRGAQMERCVNKQSVRPCWSLITCHKVPESNGGEGDDHEVQRLQRGPALDVFKDGRWKRHKQQAAEEHEQQGGDDADLRLTDVPVLRDDDKQNRECRHKVYRGSVLP